MSDFTYLLHYLSQITDVNLLIDTGHIHLSIHTVTDYLAEEICEVHRDEDEEEEVIEQSDDAEQSLGEEIQGREEVGKPDEAEDGDPDLEGSLEPLPSPQG